MPVFIRLYTGFFISTTFLLDSPHLLHIYFIIRLFSFILQNINRIFVCSLYTKLSNYAKNIQKRPADAGITDPQAGSVR